MLSGNSNLSNLSDNELSAEYKTSGKREYMRELFSRYLPHIYGVCLHYLKDADDADDAVLQIYNLLLSGREIDDIAEFRPWIYDFTKKYCLRIKGKEQEPASANSDESVVKSDKVLDLLENKDESRIDLLAACLKELPEQQRVSVNYFFRDKLSYAEIADREGYTLRNVKNYIQKGRQNLQNGLEKHDK